MSTIWTHDKELSFLEIYQCYPIIWDPKHCEHKDRNKVHDAWNEISEKLNTPVKELKSKKDSLMTTYRMHKRKIKLSEQSGAGSDDIYTPIWFAFSLMNSFLGDVIDSKSNKTRNTITVSIFFIFIYLLLIGDAGSVSWQNVLLFTFLFNYYMQYFILPAAPRRRHVLPQKRRLGKNVWKI